MFSLGPITYMGYAKPSSTSKLAPHMCGVVAAGRPEHNGAVCAWERERSDAGAQEGLPGTDSGGDDRCKW